MSKLMSDLKQLSHSRKGDEDLIFEEAPEDIELPVKRPEYKGIYFLSFLVILLIGFSVFSISISFKTLAQLDSYWEESSGILETVKQQQADILAVRETVADYEQKGLQRGEALAAQVENLKSSVHGMDDTNKTLEGKIKELETSNKRLLDRFITLNEKVKKFSDGNLIYLNTY